MKKNIIRNMETQQNGIIEQTMKSADKKRPVPVPDSLLERLLKIPDEVTIGSKVIPLRTVWLAAASLTLLIAVNVVTYSATREYRTASGIYTDYFSYLDQL
jgi:hypothetical protein